MASVTSVCASTTTKSRCGVRSPAAAWAWVTAAQATQMIADEGLRTTDSFAEIWQGGKASLVSLE